MRKILAATLASAMVLSMASISAFAADYDEISALEPVPYSSYTKDDGTQALSHNGKKDTSAGNNFDVYYVNEDLFIDLEDVTIDDQDGNTVVSGYDIARILQDNGKDIDDWSLKVKKNEGSKIVDKVTLVSPNKGRGRKPMIKITFKPDFTDTEFKVDLDLTLTNKSGVIPSIDGTNGLETGGKIYFNARFYVGNRTDEGTDHDYMAGRAGIVVKPTKNEDNEVIWENENQDIAKLTFYADSSTAKYFPKLNTKWDNQAYAEYFNDQDSFLFEFISNPQISSTSRAVLELYNPYINEDGDESVDSESIIIYQIVDGLPVDVTSQFTYGENDNGDLTFATKTRVLGSYIFCEKPYDDFAEIDPVAPETNVPVDTTKKPANTGRYL